MNEPVVEATFRVVEAAFPFSVKAEVIPILLKRMEPDLMTPGLLGTSRVEEDPRAPSTGDFEMVEKKCKAYIKAIHGNMELIWFDAFKGQDWDSHIIHRSIVDGGWAKMEKILFTATSRHEYESNADKPHAIPCVTMRPYFIRLTDAKSTSMSRLSVLSKIVTVS
jgi:hypothetical protein